MRRIEKLLKDRSQKVRLSYLPVYLQMKATRLEERWFKKKKQKQRQNKEKIIRKKEREKNW